MIWSRVIQDRVGKVLTCYDRGLDLHVAQNNCFDVADRFEQYTKLLLRNTEQQCAGSLGNMMHGGNMQYDFTQLLNRSAIALWLASYAFILEHEHNHVIWWIKIDNHAFILAIQFVLQEFKLTPQLSPMALWRSICKGRAIVSDTYLLLQWCQCAHLYFLISDSSPPFSFCSTKTKWHSLCYLRFSFSNDMLD